MREQGKEDLNKPEKKLNSRRLGGREGAFCLISSLLSAGRDATSVFHDKGHSAEAYKLMTKYYIGDLRVVR